MSGRSRDRIATVSLAVVACATYLAALRVGFFSDDYQWLGRMNATLEQPSYMFSVIFRDFNPVLHAAFVLDWIVGGYTPAVWHLHSIVLHGIATGLLFLVCRRLRAPLVLSIAATSVWALNVRLSEAVIWPAARGHQLATVCSLAAVVLMLGRRPGRRLFALVFLTVGLFAKETTFFAMAAIPFFLPEWRKERGFLAGLIGLGVGFVLLNIAIKDDLHTSGAGFTALLLKVPFILLRPLGLGDYYRFDFLSLILIAAVILVVAWWLRRGYGFAGLAWVLACSAPIVPLDKLSSRYLYLPAIGYSIVLCAAWVAIRPLLRSKLSARWVPRALLVGLVVIVATNVISIQREIGDYRLLAEPYMSLAERTVPALASISNGETVVVVDGTPRTTIAELTERIQQRGNMTKLIPYRRHAIDGLIALPDLLNVVRPRKPGMLGRPAVEADEGSMRWFRYDGVELREIQPTVDVPAAPVHRAAWDAADRYFEP